MRAGRVATFLLCVCWLLGATGALAQEQDPRVVQAAEAFDAGQYERAVGLYNEALTNSPDPNPLVLYNLGVLAFKLEKHGAAIYYFRRAEATGSGEVAAFASHNLQVAEKALLEKNKARIEKGVIRYDQGHGPVFAVFSMVPRGWAMLLLLLSVVVAFLGLMGVTFLPEGGLRAMSRSFLLAALLPLVVTGAAYFGRAWLDEHWRLGIVASAEGRALEAPSTQAPSTLLPEGLEVRILESSEPEFLKIEMAEGKEAYVLATDVWPLDQPHPLR